jgi:hypothetical protein
MAGATARKTKITKARPALRIIKPGDTEFSVPSDVKVDGATAFKNEVYRTIGNAIESYRIDNNKVLVVKYIRKTVGSMGTIIAAHDTQREDRYQGKVGLLVKKGPAAWVDDPSGGVKFHGCNHEVGAWVTYRYTDGFDLRLRMPNSNDGMECRILEDAEIFGELPHPDMIW